MFTTSAIAFTARFHGCVFAHVVESVPRILAPYLSALRKIAQTFVHRLIVSWGVLLPSTWCTLGNDLVKTIITVSAILHHQQSHIILWRKKWSQSTHGGFGLYSPCFSFSLPSRALFLNSEAPKAFEFCSSEALG
jgi:hypothetical protein